MNTETMNDQNAEKGTNDYYNLQFLYEIGDKDYIAEIIDIFLSTTPVTLKEIKEHIHQQNWEDAAKGAHKLKSGLGALQMNQMLSSITAIETIAKQKSGVEQLPALADEALHQYTLVEPMLKAELEKARGE